MYMIIYTQKTAINGRTKKKVLSFLINRLEDFFLFAGRKE